MTLLNIESTVAKTSHVRRLKIVGDCGKTGRENGAMECPNIGVRRVTYDAVKLEKGENSRAVKSYADVTTEDVQTPLGQNRLIIP